MESQSIPELLASVAEPFGISLSHDGKYVVYGFKPFLARTKDTIVASLWIAEVGKEGSARQLTQGNYYDLAPAFSPDDRFVSFLSDRAKPGKASALYLLPLDGGEPQAITSTDNEMGIESYRWNSDGSAIAFVSADEKSEQRKEKHKNKDDPEVYGEDPKMSHLKILNRETGKVTTITAPGHVFCFDWSPSGKQLACVTWPSADSEDAIQNGASVHIVNSSSDSGAVERTSEFTKEIYSVCWADDGIFFCGKQYLDRSDSSMMLYRAFPTDSEDTFVPLAHGKVDDALAIKACGNTTVAYVQHGLSDQLRTFTQVLYNENHNILDWDALVREEKTTLAIAKGVTGVPAEVFSVVDGQLCRLSDHYTSAPRLKNGSSVLFEYDNDGVPMNGFYAVPTSKKDLFEARLPQPTVVIMHGGPYTRLTDCFDVAWAAQALLMDQGYLVLCPNFRGGCGHGTAFSSAMIENMGVMHADIVWQVKKGISEGYIDPKRVAVNGWSCGGYMAFCCAAWATEFKFAAAISLAGISDWDTWSLTTDIPSITALWTGRNPWNTEQSDTRVRQFSPIYHMDRISTPVLMFHGKNDTRCPVEQSIGFYRGMKAKGVECELIVYPREGHGWPMPFERNHYIDMLTRTTVFLKKHLG